MFTRDANLTLHSFAIVILDFDDGKIVASIKDLSGIRDGIQRHGDLFDRCT